MISRRRAYSSVRFCQNSTTLRRWVSASKAFAHVKPQLPIRIRSGRTNAAFPIPILSLRLRVIGIERQMTKATNPDLNPIKARSVTADPKVTQAHTNFHNLYPANLLRESRQAPIRITHPGRNYPCQSRSSTVLPTLQVPPPLAQILPRYRSDQ
jgi:hypothetical protein